MANGGSYSAKSNVFATLQVQSVLYNLPADSVARSLTYLNAAAAAAHRRGYIGAIRVSYGDCSPTPVIDVKTLEELRKQNEHIAEIDYVFYDANLGSAEGHNRLLEQASADLVMILNPDVLASPTLIIDLCEGLQRADAGMVEARQIPIEHPKDYDAETGETGWGSTACLMGPAAIFKELKGFDSKSFFLYCDDVDFSWRVRLLGKKIIFCPNAVIFHDKRLSRQGGWIGTAAERYYSAEAALFLTHKYSRGDLTERYLRIFEVSGEPEHVRAAAAFTTRREAGLLPEPIDQHHLVAQFIDGNYALHRFKSR